MLLSLASLASGTTGGVMKDGIYTAVSVVSYPFWKALNAVSDGAGYVTGLVFSYRTAREEAESARREIHLLMPQLAEREELEGQNRRLRAMLAFERSHPRFAMLPAEVVSRSGGMLVIDRGSLHGVREFMCAMTKDGVVGVVTRVEPTLSKVATLHSADCKIGAMIRRNRVTGVIHGSGSDYGHICSMRYIDLKDEVRVGDQVVTSRGSALYPAGFPIGSVTQIHEEGALQKTALVQPAADPYRLDEVFLVVKAQIPPEELAGASVEPEFASMAPTMPDSRPIQERYAP